MVGGNKEENKEWINNRYSRCPLSLSNYSSSRKRAAPTMSVSYSEKGQNRK